MVNLILGRLRAWLLAALGALAAVMGLWAAAERARRLADERRRAEAALAAAREAKEVRDDVEGLGDDDLRKRLDRFVRDERG